MYNYLLLKHPTNPGTGKYSVSIPTSLYTHPRPCTLTHEDFLANLLYMLVVSEHGDKTLQCGKLTVQSQQKEHEKKQDGPKRSTRHAKKSFADNHKCQTRALEYLRVLGGKSAVSSRTVFVVRRLKYLYPGNWKLWPGLTGSPH